MDDYGNASELRVACDGRELPEHDLGRWAGASPRARQGEGNFLAGLFGDEHEAFIAANLVEENVVKFRSVSDELLALRDPSKLGGADSSTDYVVHEAIIHQP